MAFLKGWRSTFHSSRSKEYFFNQLNKINHIYSLSMLLIKQQLNGKYWREIMHLLAGPIGRLQKELQDLYTKSSSSTKY